MAISHEQVVDSLIAFYKNRNVDLSYLLDDPVFEKLPVDAKVEALKRNAAAFSQHTSSGWTSSEKSEVSSGAANGAITGALTAGMAIPAGMALLASRGIPLASSMANSKALAITLGGSALVGSILGGIASYAKTRNDVLARHQLKNQFAKLQANPNDENAVGALSLKGVYSREHNLRKALVGRVADRLDSMTTDVLNKSDVDKFYATNYATFDPNVRSYDPF